MFSIDISTTTTQISPQSLRLDLDLVNRTNGSKTDEHTDVVNNTDQTDASNETRGINNSDSARNSDSASAENKDENRDQKEIDDLEKRDREVRVHELAHQAVAGSLAQGGPSFKFERGPNGKFFAVSGSVKIDTSEESSPEKTIVKMQVVKRAALAPANPSSKDRAVAADAAAKEADARKELANEKSENVEDLNGATNSENNLGSIKMANSGGSPHVSDSSDVKKLAGGSLIDTYA